MTAATEATIFAFSDDHDEFRAHVRRFMESRSSSGALRRLISAEAGHDPAVWRQMAEQLGLQGLVIPARYGGSGYSFVELSIALEEMGRVLLYAPFLPTLIATVALLSSQDSAACDEYLPQIAAGDLTATLALTGDTGDWDAVGDVVASSTPSGWSVEGHKSFVLDGQTAGLIIVAAATSSGHALFAVSGDADGLDRTPLPTLDLTRPQARLQFASTPARRLGSAESTALALARTLDLAAIALASEQVGGAQRALDMSVAYAKDRVQFGRPIGAFQAIKHTCAEMLVDVELARSLAYGAAWLADDDAERPLVAPLAKAQCSEAFVAVATKAIQIHGGTGFTWEHDAHLYLRRAKSSEQYLGDPTYHRERYASRIKL
jgi:alkylation response protein AidB-like acyl-CoA dehydrogenase